MLLLGITAVSCQPQTESSPTLSSVDTTISIATIRANPTRYEGNEITLQGTFSGWKGEIVGAPPETRSDWLVEDETGWLYVTGNPSGLDPIDDLGHPIEVTGLVKITDGGEPYLLALEINTELSYSTYDLINRDYQNGKIDYDERTLYIVYSIYEPEALPAEYLSDTPSRNATTLILEIQRNWDQLSPETQAKISPYIQPLSE